MAAFAHTQLLFHVLHFNIYFNIFKHVPSFQLRARARSSVHAERYCDTIGK